MYARTGMPSQKFASGWEQEVCRFSRQNSQTLSEIANGRHDQIALS